MSAFTGSGAGSVAWNLPEAALTLTQEPRGETTLITDGPKTGSNLQNNQRGVSEDAGGP